MDANEEYHYTKEDVAKMLHFLSLHFPELATPENAIKVLVYLHEQYKSIEDVTAEELENILSDLEER